MHNAHDVPWYYVATAIVIGSALLSYGVNATAIAWEKDAGWPKWFSVVGSIAGIVLSIALGAVVGAIVWEWVLGLLCATVGAFASPWILRLIWSRFGSGDPPPPPEPPAD